MSSCFAITAFLPSIVSKSIFAPRRANKSMDADNAPVSIMNACVATAQLAKAGEGIIEIAHSSKGDLATKVVDIDNALKEIPKTDSVFKGAGQVARFGMEHINGLIGATAIIKALCSEDQESALIQEGAAVAGMLACEKAHKAVFGTTKTKYINGKNKVEIKEGLYKEIPLLKNSANKVKAYCKQKGELLEECNGIKKFIGKAVKLTPEIAKGGTFAAVSIGGYAISHLLGGELAENITGRQVA